VININPLVEAALAEVAYEIHNEILDNIESPHWYWPNETIRKHKPPAGSPRDIVDSRELLESQKVDVDDLHVRFYNTAFYSDLVHEGGSNGHAILPARPFMTDALEDGMSITERIAEKLKANLSTDKRGVTRLRDNRGWYVKDAGLRDITVETETTEFDY
jgi:phage gpG-like protein